MTRADLPFYGEAAWSDWEVVEVGDDRIALKLKLRTSQVELLREVTLSDRSFEIAQTFTNSSGSDAAVEWTEHIAWGGALLGESMSLHVDGTGVELSPWSAIAPSGLFTAVPTMAGCYVLRNDQQHLAVEVTFDPRHLPWVVIWQEHRRLGAPWFGRVDAIGVEPSASDFVNTEPTQRNALVVPSHRTISSTIVVRIHDPEMAAEPDG